MTRPARLSLRVSGAVLVSTVLVVAAVRPEVLLGFVFATIAAATAIVVVGLVGGALHDGALAVGAAAVGRHRAGVERLRAHAARERAR